VSQTADYQLNLSLHNREGQTCFFFAEFEIVFNSLNIFSRQDMLNVGDHDVSNYKWPSLWLIQISMWFMI